MTVKDEHLYVGGLGKEWTTPDGSSLTTTHVCKANIPKWCSGAFGLVRRIYRRA
ncbi:Soluble calcium-activated nucleotidase 1 [Caligus rogercresseyi]|uniref:Soluble calcium-activated nucleotidase 1 n=1 Tax=Caligus rogercresseyi TaxID=217165 RepID=A0A7T8KBS7_CALRO|nr:Soluble calcium-activated nucleotidase 1 [Caligus rogercresseyi]